MRRAIRDDQKIPRLRIVQGRGPAPRGEDLAYVFAGNDARFELRGMPQLLEKVYETRSVLPSDFPVLQSADGGLLRDVRGIVHEVSLKETGSFGKLFILFPRRSCYNSTGNPSCT